MIRPTPTPPRSGLTGLVAVFCLAALIAGLGFDFGVGAHSAFWLGATPGAAAAAGVAAAVFVVIVARVALLLFGPGRKT